ncbi:MAG: hypothetical protein C0616_07265 [Desulfuromonas sp.]|nr:MAG: hypothetical protein C0616_07265 [Desulfuromonas sp.]
MTKRRVCCLMSLALVLTGLFGTTSLASVEISDPVVVHDLIAVQSEIDSISSAVMACMGS